MVQTRKATSGKRARSNTVRFAMPPHAPGREATAFRAAVFEASGLVLDVLQMPSYAALFEAIDTGDCGAGWTPPLVALDLVRCRTAHPVLALARGPKPLAYHAVVVVRDDAPVKKLGDLVGRRIGWVARQSASGYVVPRLHLAALGVDVDRFFGREDFYGSHARALDALVAGEVDAVATHGRLDETTGRVLGPRLGIPTRVLAAAGPIPADVVVVRDEMPASTRAALADALMGLRDQDRATLIPLVHARRFVPVGAAHLDPLRALASHAEARAFAKVAGL